MASPNSQSTTVGLGGGSPMQVGGTGGQVGFYGTTPISQLSGATETTITASWVAVSSGFGFDTSAAIISIIAAVKTLQSALTTIGFWKGSA